MPPRIQSLSLGMVHAYLIEHEAGLVLVDAGFPGHEGRVLGRMRALGPQGYLYHPRPPRPLWESGGAAGSYSLELTCVPNLHVPFVLRGYGR